MPDFDLRYYLDLNRPGTYISNSREALLLLLGNYHCLIAIGSPLLHDLIPRWTLDTSVHIKGYFEHRFFHFYYNWDDNLWIT